MSHHLLDEPEMRDVPPPGGEVCGDFDGEGSAVATASAIIRVTASVSRRFSPLIERRVG